jgi:hypothetical protein
MFVFRIFIREYDSETNKFKLYDVMEFDNEIPRKKDGSFTKKIQDFIDQGLYKTRTVEIQHYWKEKE